jgi:hypothetical protein
MVQRFNTVLRLIKELVVETYQMLRAFTLFRFEAQKNKAKSRRF